MNSFSHTLIGKILLKHVQEQFGVELDQRAFLYGCVLPDFRKSYKKLPHKRYAWEHYLKSEIVSLSRHKQTGKRFSRDYSKRLGIICHFYTDFFCLPHTDVFDGGTYEHMKYEWVLDRHLREKAEQLRQTDLGLDQLPSMTADAIYGDFEALQALYDDNTADFMRDLSFTLRACAGAIAAITDNAVVTAPRPAARLVGLVAQVANG